MLDANQKLDLMLRNKGYSLRSLRLLSVLCGKIISPTAKHANFPQSTLRNLCFKLLIRIQKVNRNTH